MPSLGPRFTWFRPALALVVVSGISGIPALGQQPKTDSVPSAASSPATLIDSEMPAIPPLVASAGSSPTPESSDYLDYGMRDPWIFYLKSGPVTSLGSGELAPRLGTGWTVQAGAMERISCPNSAMDFFVDLGAGFLSTDGTDQAKVTSGFFFASIPPETNIHPLQNFFITRVSEFRRTDLHAALDLHYTPPFLNDNENRQLFVNFRGGARGSAIGESYAQTPTAALQTLIDAASSPDALGQGRGGRDPRVFIFFSYARKNDIGFGLFGGVGAGITYRDVQIRGFHLASVTLGAEVEFSNDWMSLGDLTGGEKSVWFIAPMVSLSFSF
ncbi:MAG TPA: hypothetical protein VGY77_06655 [Gemmataceae bacterium]|nr:hypothetical protein [Gemmataceae bacterium]